MGSSQNVMGEPPFPVPSKAIDRLDKVGQLLIAKSPFVVLASAGSDGYLVLPPKGDPAELVQVVDE